MSGMHHRVLSTMVHPSMLVEKDGAQRKYLSLLHNVVGMSAHKVKKCWQKSIRAWMEGLTMLLPVRFYHG